MDRFWQLYDAMDEARWAFLAEFWWVIVAFGFGCAVLFLIAEALWKRWR
jgi:hypothetical protein